MFKRLTDFSYQRTWIEAVGFYIAYSILFLPVGMVASAILAIIFAKADPNEIGERIGPLVAILAPTAISFIVLHRKNRIGNFLGLFLMISAGLLSAVGGAFLGFLPAAFLTTRSINKQSA